MGIAQKMCLPLPLEVESSFGRKFILSRARETKLGRMLNSHGFNRWQSLVLIFQTTYEFFKINQIIYFLEAAKIAGAFL